MSRARAATLKPLLDAFASPAAWHSRIAADPLEFPSRYHRPRDVEVVGLLSAALAYGRADLFKPKIAGLLAAMGSEPAEYLRTLTVPRAARLLDGFVYRFNLPADMAVLLLGMGQSLKRWGSLEALFLAGPSASHEALAHFTGAIREAAPLARIVERLGPTRGLQHLLPAPLGPGAAKRLNLFLRWVVRGPDGVDLGIWKQVSSARLMIPLDTHVGRIARHLGLTSRNDLSWRTAEEVTASLRLLDADDPIRYDFALCHYGMSGVCPAQPVAANCRRCALRAHCRASLR